MFLSVHSRASVDDLLRGLLIQSGNDAAMTLAEGLAGSEDAFADLMNKRAAELGMTHSHFTNSRGKADPAMTTTATDMAILAAHLVRDDPDYFHYFSDKEFTWNKIRQLNRNPALAFTDLGVDGLKAGTPATGATPLSPRPFRTGSGSSSSSTVSRTRPPGSRRRASFSNMASMISTGAPCSTRARRSAPPPSMAGRPARRRLSATKPIVLFVPRGDTERLVAKITYMGPLVAPVAADVDVGHLRIWRGDMLAVDAPLKTGKAVALGGLTRRASDAVIELAGQAVRRELKRYGLMK